jgi:type IV secretory pathway VirB10-like protein
MLQVCGAPPDVEFVDLCIAADKRTVRVWKNVAPAAVQHKAVRMNDEACNLFRQNFEKACYADRKKAEKNTERKVSSRGEEPPSKIEKKRSTKQKKEGEEEQDVAAQASPDAVRTTATITVTTTTTIAATTAVTTVLTIACTRRLPGLTLPFPCSSP